MDGFYEITPDDFQVVAQAHGVKIGDAQAAELLAAADYDDLTNGIDNLADLADQTNAVYQEIEKHLTSENVIPAAVSKFAA